MSEMIDGRVKRKTANALAMEFRNGPGEPLAVALQSGADGKGAKMGILFGFKNGGSGTHVLTYADGRVVHVKTVDSKPTQITQPDGATIATIERGDFSVARASGGTEIVTFRDSAEGGRTSDARDARRLVMTVADGSELGRLDVVLRTGGWALVDDLTTELLWWGQAGAPLKVPVLGTRLQLARDMTDLERDVVLGACVDIAIGLRPYVKGM
jgi:hypothetical protein